MHCVHVIMPVFFTSKVVLSSLQVKETLSPSITGWYGPDRLNFGDPFKERKKKQKTKKSLVQCILLPKNYTQASVN